MAEPDPDFVASIRRYYRSLDAHRYDRLRSALHPAFVQYRPDKTLEGRDRFISFMRDDRPVPDTEHRLAAWFRPMAASDLALGPGDEPTPPSGEGALDFGTGEDGENPDTDRSARAPSQLAIRGEVRRPDGPPLLAFVDVHGRSSPSDPRIRTIHTYAGDPDGGE